MATIPETLQTALQCHRGGRLQEAEALYRQILQVDPNHADAVHLLGVVAHQAGHHGPAIELITQAIRLNPSAPEYYNNIGLAYWSTGKVEEAEAHYRRALALMPEYADALVNLGNLLRTARGLANDAMDCYRRALAIAPTHPDGNFNVGVVLHMQGRLDDAMASYRQALLGKPDHAEAHHNLAMLLHATGKLDEAEVHYRQALSSNPKMVQAHQNFVRLMRDRGRFQAAAAWCAQAIAMLPNAADLHNELGCVLTAQGNVELAEVYYRRAIELNGAFAGAHKNLAASLKDQGRLQEAAIHYRRVLELVPLDGVRILLETLLPVIPESKEDVLESRRRYANALARLSEQRLTLRDPSVDVGATTFYLAYQGMNDRDLQRAIGRLYEQACPSLAYVAPHCRDAPRTRDGPVKIGFLSSLLRDHTIGRLMRGIIANLSREAFTVTVFQFPHERDLISGFIADHADRVIVLPTVLEAARTLVAQEQLDILFYPDIGMDPFTYFLAFSRLAPVQCVTWGHPDTTGLPSMDYFISSELLETDEAEAHYTEQLVRLKHLPTYYYKPEAPAVMKSRRDFGLEDGRVAYLCPQSLFKLHPDYDEVLAEVLRRHPEAQMAVIEAQFKHFTYLLRQRFRNTIPDVAERIRVVPRQSSRDFIGLLSVVDVILDPIKWSGGSTTYEALSFGTPIVTMPSEFMRGRVTYACYKQMGVMDCVAASTDEYVRLAVRLGTDPAYRAGIKKKILARNHVLYENMEAVREFERAFLRMVNETRRT